MRSKAYKVKGFGAEGLGWKASGFGLGCLVGGSGVVDGLVRAQPSF